MNKVAVVTGGAKRVGKAICEHLATNGYSILIHYLNSRDEALVTKQTCLTHGASLVEIIQCDLREPQQRSNFITNAMTLMGRIDLLVNSASMFEYDTAQSFNASIWHEHLQSNYLAPVELTMALYKACAECTQMQAHVVTLLDQKVMNLNTDYMGYTLSKLASHASIRYLAQCCAPHLRVNAVAPGLTMLSGSMQDNDFEQAHKIAALGRSNTPVDLAQTILMLDQAQAITGQTIVVDGGQHLIPRGRDVAFEEHK